MNPQDPYRPTYQGVSAGTRLNGIYEIDRMIGVGGMGEVYKGHEIQTGTTVAIKMLLPEMAANEMALALFRKEASALHYLMHEAIVRYFVFTIEPFLQRPYLAMEFVDGRSLAEMLEDGPLTFEALLRLMRRVASGLKAAHERGIIHRDVSPDNIIIPQSDVARAKIIDFGIARSTQTGDATIIDKGFAGKNSYVSPEQIGLYGGDVTAKSDVYSFGLVLFYALAGQKLDMGGSQFQLVEKRRRVPDLGAIDSRIRPLLEKMLRPDPRDRPTMAEVEIWGVGPLGRISSRQVEHTSVTPGKNRLSRLKGLWVRYTAFAAACILFIGIAGGAYYKFFWSVPSAPTSQIASTKVDVTTLKPSVPPTPPGPSGDPPLATTRLPPVSPASGDEARRFLQQYDGGDCFFIVPVAVEPGAATVEGFGASTAPFDLLDRSFKKSFGFEAQIGIRLVTAPECPAVAFLNRFRGNTSRTPRIWLGSNRLQPGQSLQGTVENFANRVVELLLVADDGSVQNISYLLKPGTDSLSFSLEVPRSDTSGASVPQLLMAVTTPRVLDSLRQPRPTPADVFFVQVVSEAQRANLTLNVSAKYFIIRK